MKMHFYSVIILVFFGCGNVSNEVESIKVACAANMQFAMDSIAIVFEAEYGIKCEITPSASGILTAQIQQGAPYNIFLSANEFYPDLIYDQGKGNRPEFYARGRLIFAYDKRLNYSSLTELLGNSEFGKIAIADLETSPYGSATNQFLVNKGFKKSISEQIVIGESIGQVNQYLMTNAVNGGFTSYTFKVKNRNKFNYFEVSQADFKPINQTYTIIKQESVLDANTQELGAFFKTEKAKSIFKHFGYITE